MQGESKKSAYLALILSMVIFGTIGIFRRQIDLPSETLAFVRGILGSVFLLLAMRLTGRRFQTAPLRGSLMLLVLTGAMIGFNWILLFEAYYYTTVAVATLCYYMQPVIVLLVSPLLFKEPVTLRKFLCVAAALAGMVLVSGAAGSSSAGTDPVKGMLLGLGAAALYASVVMLNKKITGVPVYEKTIIQAALVPYMLARGSFRSYAPGTAQVILLLTVGIIHTGLAYALYFGAVEKLPVQTAALFSYIDPVTAVLLSALFLHEPMTPAGIAGAVLILGALMLA